MILVPAFDHVPRLRSITNAVHNIRQVDSVGSPGGILDHREDDASYALGCPSYIPLRRDHNRRAQHEGCKLKIGKKIFVKILIKWKEV